MDIFHSPVSVLAAMANGHSELKDIKMLLVLVRQHLFSKLLRR
jgi:hypothetical protein